MLYQTVSYTQHFCDRVLAKITEILHVGAKYMSSNKSMDFAVKQDMVKRSMVCGELNANRKWNRMITITLINMLSCAEQHLKIIDHFMKRMTFTK